MNQSARVLIADDDRDTADTTAELLQLSGYETRAVYNGLQAVHTARVFGPHVAVLDLNMPVMDGYEAAVVLRREGTRKNLILIAHSAQTEPHEIERAHRSGFDHHLAKPADSGKLQTLIESALRDAGSEIFKL